MKEPCPHCGVYIMPGKKTCDACGGELPTFKRKESKPMNKNLIHCKDCNGIVSKTAKACPHCGASVETGVQKVALSLGRIGRGLISLGILSFIVYVTFALVFGDKKPKETIEQKTIRMAEQRQERIKYNAERLNLSVDRYTSAVEKYGTPPGKTPSIVKYYLKDHYLKDPDSLKIEGYTPLYLGSKGWQGAVQYRAKNSFGGYAKETKRFVIRQNKVVSFQ